MDQFTQQYVLSIYHVAVTMLDPKDTLGSEIKSLVSLDFHFKREKIAK